MLKELQAHLDQQVSALSIIPSWFHFRLSLGQMAQRVLKGCEGLLQAAEAAIPGATDAEKKAHVLEALGPFFDSFILPALPRLLLPITPLVRWVLINFLASNFLTYLFSLDGDN